MEQKLCECGCGQPVKPGNRFINHHYTRVMSSEVRERIRTTLKSKHPQIKHKPCECGCENFPKNPKDRFCRGHGTRINNSMKGKHHSEETKAKQREASIKFYNNPDERERCRKQSTGYKHTPEAIAKIKEANKNKSPEEIEKRRQKVLERTGGIRAEGLSPYDLYEPQLLLYEEGLRKHPDDERVLQVKCYKCKEWMSPTPAQVTDRIQAIKGKGRGECHFYCSDKCKRTCDIFGKQPNPPHSNDDDEQENGVQGELRQMRLAIDNYTCKKCGYREETGKNLHCHHVKTVKCEPIESADVDTCITYCVSCHIEAHRQPGCGFGELGSYEFDESPLFKSEIESSKTR